MAGSMKAHHPSDGLAGLAAREAVNHPAASTEVTALVAEVERLRAESDLLRTGRDATRDYADRVEQELVRLRAEVAALRMLRDEYKMDTMHAYEEGGHAERAAVVAWLREQRRYCTDSTGAPNAVTATYAHAADAIERGEHRKETP
jgi:outer membrane murein-binding lipoprotein Lpp